MTEQEIVIVDYAPEHGLELVRMWRASFEQALGIVDPHPLPEQLRYLQEKVIPDNQVLVVLDERRSSVIGFMASTPETISQLYVHVDYQNRGIGSRLVNIAKEHSRGRLRLFTFKANESAQRFYERHGFRVIGAGFEKEWELEDVEYEWSISPYLSC